MWDEEQKRLNINLKDDIKKKKLHRRQNASRLPQPQRDLNGFDDAPDDLFTAPGQIMQKEVVLLGRKEKREWGWEIRDKQLGNKITEGRIDGWYYQRGRKVGNLEKLTVRVE